MCVYRAVCVQYGTVRYGTVSLVSDSQAVKSSMVDCRLVTGSPTETMSYSIFSYSSRTLTNVLFCFVL